MSTQKQVVGEIPKRVGKPLNLTMRREGFGKTILEWGAVRAEGAFRTNYRFHIDEDEESMPITAFGDSAELYAVNAGRDVLAFLMVNGYHVKNGLYYEVQVGDYELNAMAFDQSSDVTRSVTSTSLSTFTFRDREGAGTAYVLFYVLPGTAQQRVYAWITRVTAQESVVLEEPGVYLLVVRK